MANDPAAAASRYYFTQSPSYGRSLATSVRMMDEYGVSGLRQYGGFVVEEWLRNLSGPRAAWVWREMADNDATIGSIIFAIEMLARGVEWTVEEGEREEDAQLIEECREDMDTPWGEVISEAFTMVVFGFALCEILYKKRLGEQELKLDDSGNVTSLPSSRFDDGKIGWHKLPLRGQETIWRWIFDETGGILAAEQIAWDGRPRIIPMQKALLFRTKATKNNPLGRPCIRNAFTSWYAKKNIEQIEQIGIERDLAGIPTITPPDEVDLSSPENESLKLSAEELVRQVKRDEYEGIVLPQGGWKFELVSAAGARQIDTNEVIKRYDLRIATSVLADMLLTGQDKVGSYAMVDVKADIFGAAVDTWLDGIAEVFNRYAIPRLLKLNGIKTEEPPQLKHSPARRVNAESVAELLEHLSLAGFQVAPDEDVKAMIYELAGLPTPAAVDMDAARQAEEGEPAAEADPTAGEDAARETENAGQTPQERESAAKAPVAKAERPHAKLAASYEQGRRKSEGAFKREITALFRELGEAAAQAYTDIHISEARKAEKPTTDDKALAAQIMAKLDLAGWIRKLARAWHRHYSRVTGQVVDSLNEHLKENGKVAVPITQPERSAVATKGALRVAQLEAEKRVRESIEAALAEARTEGVGWEATARKLQEHISAGPFIHAGPKYRAELIARTETTQAQTQAQLAAYRAHPDIVECEYLDGLKNDSDQFCKDRDGERASFEEAAQAAASEHPLGTLTILPVFQSEVEHPEAQLVAA